MGAPLPRDAIRERFQAGVPLRVIADELGCSYNGAKNHVRDLEAPLERWDQAALTRACRSLGLTLTAGDLPAYREARRIGLTAEDAARVASTGKPVPARRETRRPPLGDAERKEIRDRRARGESVKAVARAMGISPTAVRQHGHGASPFSMADACLRRYALAAGYDLTVEMLPHYREARDAGATVEEAGKAATRAVRRAPAA